MCFMNIVFLQVTEFHMNRSDVSVGIDNFIPYSTLISSA
jgi:hypothetical protein